MATDINLDTLANLLAERLGIDIPAQDTAQETGVEVEAPAKPKRKTTARKAPAKPAAKPAAKPRKTTRAKRGVLTCGAAWEALGADPEFEPKDPSKPATGPQLWRLNADGKLAALLA